MSAILPQLADLAVLPAGERRQQARAAFLKHGLPTARLEAWKFTPLRGLAERSWARAANDAAGAASEPAKADRLRLVFEGGQLLDPAASARQIPAGVSLRPLTDADIVVPDQAAESLVALNGALCNGGWLIELTAGISLQQPLHLDFRSGDGIACPLVHLRIGAGAALALLETHIGGQGWSNPVVRIAIGEGAVLEHARLQSESASAHHIAFTEMQIASRGKLRHVSAMTGGRVARHELSVRLLGVAAEADILGVALARGAAHLDHTLRLEHLAEGCTSQQDFRNAVDDAGHAVFQGCIRVAPGAQRTDAAQICRTLLLSDAARVDTKPELEILADDVKCSHGATVGDLDPAHLFYLQARGIGAAEARRLLLAGFAEENILAVQDAVLRAELETAVHNWLHAGGVE